MNFVCSWWNWVASLSSRPRCFARWQVIQLIEGKGKFRTWKTVRFLLWSVEKATRVTLKPTDLVIPV